MERPTAWSPARIERSIIIGSILTCLAALGVMAAEFTGKVSKGSLSHAVPAALVLGFGALFFVLTRCFLFADRAHRETVGVLDATEQKFKSVFDNALDGFLVFDESRTCLEANQAVCSLLGLPRSALIGKSLPTFLLPREDDSSTARKCLTSCTPARAEARFSRTDGRMVIIEYTASANFLPGLHVVVLRDITQKKEAETALRESERRFQQMAENIQEVFWMMDAKECRILYVNAAYEAITGLSRQTLIETSESFIQILHPEDRPRIVSRMREALQSGNFDEEFRIVRPDGMVRWVYVRSSPVKNDLGIVQRLVGSARDVTARKAAEQDMARNFVLAEAARAEAEALRKTSLALTQNLSMDYVLDRLLQALLELVPCELAQIMLLETGTRLFLARELSNYKTDCSAYGSPETVDAQASRHLIQIITSRESALVADAADEVDWPSFAGFSHLRSWLCVPLIGSNEILGLLSLGDTKPKAFTEEHLRLAKSLAIPAAVAIQNARLYEQTEIFRSGLEQQLANLQRTDKAAGQLHRSSEAW